MTSPKGGKTQTTTQSSSTNYPQWTQDALQGLVGAGAAINAPFIQTPNYTTAGMNVDQQKAFDLARMSAQTAYTGGPTTINGTGMATPAQLGAPAQMTAANANGAQIGATTMAGAQQVDPATIESMMNPYRAAVIDPALKQAARSRDENQASIGMRAAASGSFGGSREAIERGQADRAYQESTATMVAQLMAQGYDQATALAQANAQMRQQAELTNAAAKNNSTLAQAGYDQQSALTNSGYQQQAGQNNQQALLQALMTQGGYDQQAGMYNAQAPLTQAQMQDNLKSSDLSRQQSALAQLLGIGNQQQLFTQSVLDQPYTALQRYAALVPQVYNQTSASTGTAPNNSPSPLQSLLGAGLAIGGMGTGGGGTLLGSAIKAL